jgi:hypothetical protein
VLHVTGKARARGWFLALWLLSTLSDSDGKHSATPFPKLKAAATSPLKKMYTPKISLIEHLASKRNPNPCRLIRFGCALAASAAVASAATLNVTNYGAIPNDSGDDTAGIQAAMNASVAGVEFRLL